MGLKSGFLIWLHWLTALTRQVPSQPNQILLEDRSPASLLEHPPKYSALSGHQ
jgi:hypothetical protein